MEYQSPKFSNKELLELFPEAKKIIRIKIKEHKNAIKKKEQEIASILNGLYAFKTDEFSEWFCEQVIKMFMMPELEKINKNIFKLKGMNYSINPSKKKYSYHMFQEKIAIAKQHPIEELARSHLKLRPVGKNFISLCPFHNEKRPSFYLYTNTNTFHCFGCGEHGDVINLLMTLHEIDFKEAVAMLQN